MLNYVGILGTREENECGIVDTSCLLPWRWKSDVFNAVVNMSGFAVKESANLTLNCMLGLLCTSVLCAVGKNTKP